LPAFHVLGYESAGEEKILKLENPLRQTLFVDGKPLPLNEAKVESQEFDPKRRVLTTKWSWNDLNFEITHLGESDALTEEIAVTLRTGTTSHVVSSKTESGLIEGDTSTYYNYRLTADDPRVSVQIEETVVGEENNGSSRIGTGLVERTARVGASGAAVFTRVFRSENIPSFPEPVFSVEIDGNPNDQQTVNEFATYLQMGIPATGQASPMGLSAETYNGHVFWDADIWMLPALALISPERAASIVKYRQAMLPAAKQNYQAWLAAGRPTASGKMDQPVPAPGDGVKFPWESSVTGKETVPGPSRFQDHITGSVAHGYDFYAKVQNQPRVKDTDLGKGARSFFIARSRPGASGRVINDTMSPDEHHTGNNDLYTNVLAQWITGKPFLLPKDAQGFLSYEGDKQMGYKQAAALLAVYPLQFKPAEKNAKVMLNRFVDRVIKNGPAMSDSVHAIVAARLGDSIQAYDFWQRAYKEFIMKDSKQFSEKRGQNRTVFFTGIGGCLQTVLFGFSGIRIDDGESGFSRKPLYTSKLRSGARLTVTPCLPPTWNRITLRNVFWDGKPHNLTITPNQVIVQ
jgi:trehalose/maltose hydrolase-like predicted phosphorylase